MRAKELEVTDQAIIDSINLIISNYTKQAPEMTIEAVKNTVVIKIDIERMTARVYGY